jgi:hypothetical protein
LLIHLFHHHKRKKNDGNLKDIEQRMHSLKHDNLQSYAKHNVHVQQVQFEQSLPCTASIIVVKQPELPEQPTHSNVLEELHYSVCAEEHLEIEQPLLPLYDQPIYPLAAEEPKEVEEVASNDPYSS